MSGPLVLYDGACGVCALSVRFVLARERGTALRFAPLAGETAAAVVRAHPWIAGVDSLVFVDRGRVRVRSAAALALVRYLRWPWPLLRAGWLVPAPIRDALYDLLARHRHRLIGTVPPIDPGAAAGRLLP